jgi:hypothetical protein
MIPQFRAVADPELEARVTGSLAMIYEAGASVGEDRPAHVRAASGMSAFREYLAVIQDDANWLALIDGDHRVVAVPLPPSSDGARVFSKRRGNKHDKYDLEACVTVPCGGGNELIGFSSGSRRGREWILRVGDAGLSADGGKGHATANDLAADLEATFLEAALFYDSMRANTAFCGAGLNIEGALSLDDDRIMLFQRGNARPRDGLLAVDATAEVSWAALCQHLADPQKVTPPVLENIRRFDLGQLDGVRLTFSDAESLGDGRILYSASAEDGDTDRIAGSVLGVIEADGGARWAELIDQDGSPFEGKIEGLTRDIRDPSKIHFVIDDDNEAVPSKIYEALLSEAFFSSRGARVEAG